MTAIGWLKILNEACCGFFSTEKPRQRASNAELRRWFDKGAILVNGAACGAFDEVAELREIVLFPSSERRRTSFRFDN